MNFIRRFILICLIAVSCFQGIANATPSKDTLKAAPAIPDSFRVKYFTGEFFQKNGIKETYELQNFEKYDHRSYLGNIGQAVYDYYADQPIRHTGFKYFVNDFSENLVNEDSIRYYDAHHPYTKLFFLSGQKKEVKFNFIHSQNINKNLNITAYFNRVRSDGTYLRQNTNLTSIYLSSNYKSPNRHYFLLANVIFNIDKPLVNGGLKSDSTFEHTGQTDFLTLPVNLLGAQRKYRNRSVSLHQFFNLGYNTTPADSTQQSHFIPTSAFSVSSKISDDAIIYTDTQPDSGFYQNRFISSISTHDSVYFFKITNSFGWNTWDTKHGGVRRKVGLFVKTTNEIIHLYQLAGDTAMTNWILKAGQFNYTDSSSSIRMKLNEEYVIGGYNRGDYKMDLFAEKQLFNKNWNTGVYLVASNLTPEFMSLAYKSNNFMWRSHLNKEGLTSAKICIRSPKYFFEIGAFSRQYQNLVFYDQNAIPEQLQRGVGVVGAYLYKELRLGNWNFTNRITWQKPSDLTVLQFPEWVTEHSLFFRHHLQHKMNYQIGIDVFFFSSYFANNYMPATGQFYVQSVKQIGNYPFADFYVSMQLKTVRVFVKFEHVNSGFPSFTYYLDTHQPAPDRSLKLGLSWLFNN